MKQLTSGIDSSMTTKKLNKQTACCLHVGMLWYVVIITTQDKDSTRKNSSGLLHAMIKVKMQKIALLAVVGWHHQCPNSLFHNSSRIHKCQQWQGMTRVPPPKVPKWLRLKLWQALPAKTVGLGCLGGATHPRKCVHWLKCWSHSIIFLWS
jgi:hypothetical protein